MNIGHLQIVWTGWRYLDIRFGQWPGREDTRKPVYDYLRIGPVEIRRIL